MQVVVRGNQVNPKDYAVPIEDGGTAGMTVQQAKENLGYISKDEVGVPDGVVRLNAQGLIPVSVHPNPNDVIKLVATLEGPSQVMLGQSGTYKITDYDSFINYSFTTTNGTVTRVTDTVTYTPATVGAGGFKVGGQDCPVLVVDAKPRAPTIISPVNGATGLGKDVDVVSSAFSSPVPNDTIAGCTCQMATDAYFANIVRTGTGSGISPTTWTGNLQANTTYYTRLRHNGTVSGAGLWSSTVTFTTKASFTYAVVYQGAKRLQTTDGIDNMGYAWSQVASKPIPNTSDYFYTYAENIQTTDYTVNVVNYEGKDTLVYRKVVNGTIYHSEVTLPNPTRSYSTYYGPFNVDYDAATGRFAYVAQSTDFQSAWLIGFKLDTSANSSAFIYNQKTVPLDLPVNITIQQSVLTKVSTGYQLYVFHTGVNTQASTFVTVYEVSYDTQLDFYKIGIKIQDSVPVATALPFSYELSAPGRQTTIPFITVTEYQNHIGISSVNPFLNPYIDFPMPQQGENKGNAHDYGFRALYPKASNPDRTIYKEERYPGSPKTTRFSTVFTDKVIYDVIRDDGIYGTYPYSNGYPSTINYGTKLGVSGWTAYSVSSEANSQNHAELFNSTNFNLSTVVVKPDSSEMMVIRANNDKISLFHYNIDQSTGRPIFIEQLIRGMTINVAGRPLRNITGSFIGDNMFEIHGGIDDSAPQDPGALISPGWGVDYNNFSILLKR